MNLEFGDGLYLTSDYGANPLTKDDFEKVLEHNKDSIGYKWMIKTNEYYNVKRNPLLEENNACILQFFSTTLGSSVGIAESTKQSSIGEIIPSPNYNCNSIGETKILKKIRNKKIIEPPFTDQLSWCSAFANYIMISSGFKGSKPFKYIWADEKSKLRIESQPSSKALTWLNWGVKLKNPLFGAIAVFDRSDSTDQTLRHVGFYCGTHKEKGSLLIMGGNQHDSTACAQFYKKKNFIEFRWPSELEMPEGASNEKIIITV